MRRGVIVNMPLPPSIFPYPESSHLTRAPCLYNPALCTLRVTILGVKGRLARNSDLTRQRPEGSADVWGLVCHVNVAELSVFAYVFQNCYGFWRIIFCNCLQVFRFYKNSIPSYKFGSAMLIQMAASFCATFSFLKRGAASCLQ